MLSISDYTKDFYGWTQQQAALLRQGCLSKLDIDNIAEEIESMGRSDRRALGSHLENIMLHLLKWCYQPKRRSNSWKSSIRNGRNTVERLLVDSPSLVPHLQILVDEEYHRARRSAADETKLSLLTFPDQCPFTLEQIIKDFWPE